MIILGLAGPKVQEQMATQTAADFFCAKQKVLARCCCRRCRCTCKAKAHRCLLLFASVSSRESVGEHHHHPRRRHCPILGPLLRQLISVSPSLSTNSGPRTDFSFGCNFSGTATIATTAAAIILCPSHKPLVQRQMHSSSNFV